MHLKIKDLRNTNQTLDAATVCDERRWIPANPMLERQPGGMTLIRVSVIKDSQLD
ncbi:hypothetical protein ACO0LC_20885 [Undibacterium sp. JH2W]